MLHRAGARHAGPGHKVKYTHYTCIHALSVVYFISPRPRPLTRNYALGDACTNVRGEHIVRQSTASLTNAINAAFSQAWPDGLGVGHSPSQPASQPGRLLRQLNKVSRLGLCKIDISSDRK